MDTYTVHPRSRRCIGRRSLQEGLPRQLGPIRSVTQTGRTFEKHLGVIDREFLYLGEARTLERRPVVEPSDVDETDTRDAWFEGGEKSLEELRLGDRGCAKGRGAREANARHQEWTRPRNREHGIEVLRGGGRFGDGRAAESWCVTKCRRGAEAGGSEGELFKRGRCEGEADGDNGRSGSSGRGMRDRRGEKLEKWRRSIRKSRLVHVRVAAKNECRDVVANARENGVEREVDCREHLGVIPCLAVESCRSIVDAPIDDVGDEHDLEPASAQVRDPLRERIEADLCLELTPVHVERHRAHAGGVRRQLCEQHVGGGHVARAQVNGVCFEAKPSLGLMRQLATVTAAARSRTASDARRRWCAARAGPHAHDPTRGQPRIATCATEGCASCDEKKPTKPSVRAHRPRIARAGGHAGKSVLETWTPREDDVEPQVGSMASSVLRSILVVLVLVSATTLAVNMSIRGVVGRALESAGLPADDAVAEVDARAKLTGGIVACVAVALTLLTHKRRNGTTPLAEPPEPQGELAAMRRRLARTERIAARREVAKQIAHEIKNPLAPIRASMETLRRLRERNRPEFDAYFEEATSTVLAEVRRIAAIVNAFSKFARMPTPRFTPVNLADVLRSVAALHNTPDRTDGLRITVSITAAPTIIADADQLTQVFTNLVQNGLEAGGSCGEGPRVTLELDAKGDREVRVRIRDNGPGVEPSIQGRLFEPYVTTKRDGTGLGLAIVQTIVHEHGGEVRLAADEPSGATFEVVLPVDGPPPLAHAPAITVDGNPP